MAEQQQHVLGIKDLMAVGAHFGHNTQRRNPKMNPYIYGVRQKIHILDLTKTLPLLLAALNHVEETVAKGGRVLFVGTKRQAAEAVKQEAERCGQHYVNARWLGGTLTNWPTISASIDRMKKLEQDFESEAFQNITKKEQLQQHRMHEKLLRSLGGIRHMGGAPTILFITDTNKEHIALEEAKKLNIQTVALVDTNSDPSGITFPIPSNDDALKALQFYCYMMAEAVLKGLEREAMRGGNALKKAKQEGETKQDGEVAHKASVATNTVAKDTAPQPASEDNMTAEKTDSTAATQDAKTQPANPTASSTDKQPVATDAHKATPAAQTTAEADNASNTAPKQ